MISIFVIRFLERFTSKLATSEISIFYLISVAEETGLDLTLLETLKTGFVATRSIYNDGINFVFVWISAVVVCLF